MSDVSTPYLLLDAMVRHVREIGGVTDADMSASTATLIVTLSNGQVFRISAAEDETLTEWQRAKNASVRA